jgi:hypothetical protein
VAVAANKQPGGGPRPDAMLLQLLAGTQSLGSSSSSSPSSSPTSSTSSVADAVAGSERGLMQLRQGIINPSNTWYRAWWSLLIGAAAFTGIFVPWELGFGDLRTMYDPHTLTCWVDIVLVALFMADIGACLRLRAPRVRGSGLRLSVTAAMVMHLGGPKLACPPTTAVPCPACARLPCGSAS